MSKSFQGILTLMILTLNVPEQNISDSFLPRLWSYTHRYEVEYGGAGSGKSVFVSQKKALNTLATKGRNTLVVRKVSKDNRHSTFALMQKTIFQMDCEKYFRVNKSDMTITAVNGNEVVFAGLDDATKLKSITFKRGDLTDIWIEEADQITEEDFEMLDLRLRGVSQNPFNITLSFNPVSALSWIKKYFFDERRPDTFLHKTTYKDNPWVDTEYKKKIESLKGKNPVLYDVYGLGNWGVLGDRVFTNYSFQDIHWGITDFDPEKKKEVGVCLKCYQHHKHEADILFSPEHLRVGIDWGFTQPAGVLFGAVKDGEPYVLQEIYATEKTNDQLQELIRKEMFFVDKLHTRIIADNEEPKSIREFRKNGFNMRECRKFKGSVMFGIKFLRGKHIHFDSSCVNAKSEIDSYVFEKDKDGNVLEEPVDFHNHLMDALRYMFERDMHGASVDFLK